MYGTVNPYFIPARPDNIATSVFTAPPQWTGETLAAFCAARLKKADRYQPEDHAAKGKTAKEQTVKLGFANMQDVEITSGVQAGDQVVTMGQAQLQDNVPVQILTGTQSADAKL